LHKGYIFVYILRLKLYSKHLKADLNIKKPVCKLFASYIAFHINFI